MPSPYSEIELIEFLKGIPKAFLVHARGHRFEAVLGGRIPFLNHMAARARAAGYRPLVIYGRQAKSLVWALRRHLHVSVEMATFRQPNLPVCGPTYIRGFWSVDPQGAGYFTTMAERQFDPGAVDPHDARVFFDRIADHTLDGSNSRRDQKERSGAKRPAAAAVFLQDIDTWRERMDDLTTRQMIAAVAEATDRRIYVKPHPCTKSEVRREQVAIAKQYDHIRVTDANIHDLIAAADCVVTQNSSVGFEALLHRKPVITCAKSDFAHATLPVKHPNDMAPAMARAAQWQRDFPFEAYVTWFMGQNMFEEASEASMDAAWSEIVRLNGTWRERLYQRLKASSSSSLASTQAAPSPPISFFQNGARDFR
ncbi:MAG: CDP-glycerol glycerophosphotransferase family protein [Pseudomonadota bacterium]